MTRATLAEVLQPALAEGYAVGGLVCLGWEDARAYVRAAEVEGLPVILQAGPSCRKHTPLPVLGAMFTYLAEGAAVPVVAHLDHGENEEDIREAISCGFTSVMFDGSRLPLEENIERTAAIAEIAHAAGVSCEGEIGFVGYQGGERSQGTDPAEAARFCRATSVDAVAISVGNVHLQQDQQDGLDVDRVRAIEAATATPLVIHGGSGVPDAQRQQLARDSRICKFNVGTELRMVFGRSLRAALGKDLEVFDRVAILSRLEDPIEAAARRILRILGPQGSEET